MQNLVVNPEQSSTAIKFLPVLSFHFISSIQFYFVFVLQSFSIFHSITRDVNLCSLWLFKLMKTHGSKHSITAAAAT